MAARGRHRARRPPRTSSAADDPLGETIKVNGINFRVIGVLKAKGDQGWFNPDDQVIVPYTTAMKQLFGVDYLREIDIQAADGARPDRGRRRTSTPLLRKRHRLQPGDRRTTSTSATRRTCIADGDERHQIFTYPAGRHRAASRCWSAASAS